MKTKPYRPLTKKDIFEAKLRGERINISAETMNDMLGNDVCLLLRTGILENPGGQYYQFICRYTIRIWHLHEGQIKKVDQLDPGDLWEYSKRFE